MAYEEKIGRMQTFIGRTTYRAVQAARDAFPEHEAVRYMGRSISYSALLPEIDEIALRFVRLGVRKGDVVLFCMPNVPNIVLSVYALHKLGAAVCPVHPQSSPAELAYYLCDTGAKIAVCYAPLYPFLAEAKKSVGTDLTVVTVAPEETLLFTSLVPPSPDKPGDTLSWKTFLSLSGDVSVEEATDPDAPAVIFYSGGTTGQPKGIMLSCRNLNALALQTEDGSGLVPMSDYSMLAVIPMFHGFGFGVNVHLMLALGGTTILVPKFSATDIGETILREKPNIIAGVPTLFYAITMALKDKDCDLSFLKGAFSGGDSVPQRIKDLFNAFAAAHNCSARLREGYGLTESVTVNCITDFSGGKKGSVGIPLIGNVFSIVDTQTGRVLPAGQEGEICLSGPTVMLGYLHLPDETSKVLRRENGRIVLHTGDRGYLDEDGYLFFSSRLSRMIITNGYNVYPSEVENAIASLPFVKQACCIGITDEVQGQTVCLIVVLSREEPFAREQIEKRCERELAAYKRPSVILFRDSLPTTHVGKIAYNVLQSELESDLSLKTSSPEEALALATKKALGVETVSSAGEFFACGGNSHKILVFLSALSGLGYDLSLSDFVVAETREDILSAMRPVAPAESATRYRNDALETALSDKSVAFDAYYPISPMQTGILFHALTERRSIYNTVAVLRALRPLDETLFTQTARLLVEKYDAFRTVFFPLDSEIYAVVRKQANCPIECVRTPLSQAAYANKLTEKGLDLQQNAFQIHLVYASDGTFVFFNVHHAVSDGIGLFNAISYFIASYSRLKKGESYESLRAGIVKNDGFDYYAYLQKLRQKDDSEAKAFILREFEGFDGGETIAHSPVDEQSTPTYKKYDFALCEDADRRVRAFCVAHHYALPALCKAVWAIVLSKYSFSEDVAFGEVVSGREENVPGIDKAVGLFINTVPLRFSTRADLSFADLMETVQQKSIAYLPYLTYPASQSLRLIGPSAIPTIFNYEDNDGKSYGIGADLFVQENIYDNSNFDLEFKIAGQGVLAFGLRYNTALYADADVRLLADRIVRAFDAVLADDVRIGKIGIVSERELRSIYAFNDTAAAFDENDTVVHKFLRQAKKTPDAVAVEFYDHTLTYRELNERSDAVAADLASVGIRKGNFVAIYASRSLNMIVDILGVLKSGAAYLPLDKTYPKDRLSFLLLDSNAKAVVSDAPFPVPVRIPVLVGDPHSPSAPVDVPICGEDVAYLFYTSGTTGTPKGVLSLHKGLTNLLEAYEPIYRLTEKDVVLQSSAYTFDKSIYNIFGTLCAGGKLVVISETDILDPDRIAAYCTEKGVTFTTFTPTMIAELDPARFPTLRMLDSGGEAPNATVLKRWLPGVTVVNTYGPTEYSVNASSYVYRGTESFIPIGNPIRNTKFFVSDKGNALCGEGMLGELCIAGVGVSPGYLHLPDLTEKRFLPSIDGDGTMYRTGDLVRIRENGMIEFLNRIDTQIKWKGIRIELGEIDAALRNVRGVKDCYATLLPVNGERALCACVAGDVPAETLREELQKTLPAAVIPQYFVFVERFPVRSSGKVDEAALPKPAARRAATRRIPPETPEQKCLAQAVGELLQIPACYPDDSFFSLGGDSLKAIRLSVRLRNLGYSLAVKDVMEKRTIGEIASCLKKI